MSKLIRVVCPIALRFFPERRRIRTYGCGALVFLAGCTNTQVRWDATKMRQDVMVYYNDQIMDNLIKAKNNLPFVHVDIQSLTSAGSSQVSGTIGGGETTTNTGTRARTNQAVTTDTTSATPSHVVAGTVGLLSSVAHAAMRPFTYSVSPQRSETLTITAAPALGSQAIAAPGPTPLPTWDVTKVTETRKTDSVPVEPVTPKTPVTQRVTEITLKPAPQPVAKTVYDLYEDFAKGTDEERAHLSSEPTQPAKDRYVPGTLKKWRTSDRTEYYFIATEDKRAYYKLCKKLFTKAQTGSLEKQIQENRARIEAAESILATPLAPPQ